MFDDENDEDGNVEADDDGNDNGNVDEALDMITIDIVDMTR